jgi:hypothetical protein
VEGLARLSAWWERAERWIFWSLGFAGAVGAVAAGIAMAIQSWRGRPSNWPPRGRRRHLVDLGEAEERSA